jgi:hypothetical protein
MPVPAWIGGLSELRSADPTAVDRIEVGRWPYRADPALPPVLRKRTVIDAASRICPRYVPPQRLV